MPASRERDHARHPARTEAPVPDLGDMRHWWRPGYWNISARSAVVSGTVVLVALAVAGGGLALVLYRSLLTGIDDAAAGRVRDVVAALQFDSATQLDGALLATDQRVVAVQLIDQSGAVVTRSQSAPTTPLVPPDSIGSAMVIGLPDEASPDGDMRISGQTTDSFGTRYTVLVGAGSEGVEATVKTVMILLGCASPIVVAVAAGATYFLVGRSMRSVDAIRSRVSAISASDLTERVPVPVTHDEISALAVTMNEMLARIEAGHAAQRRFVGDASHELRSPLATIISALEVAAAHPELLDQELAATTLMPEAHRMQALVEDLLLLARADESGLALRRGDVDLDDLMAGEVQRLRRETTLAIDVELTPTRLVGDADRLSRVFRNLLENAARHAVSRIEVRIHSSSGLAIATVADDGPGIPAADRDRVFDRFVRLDLDRARTGGGAGLGLAIVAEIVAAHDGTVRVNERPGGGASMVVQLPLG
jgi:signal transduction histidine kinase